jgi:hypothetical protein
MNQAAQAIAVLAEGGRALELRPVVTAVDAQPITPEQLCAGQAIAANKALRRAERTNLSEARFANWDPGDVVEWSRTEPAIGGEKYREDTSQKDTWGRGGPGFSSLAL